MKIENCNDSCYNIKKAAEKRKYKFAADSKRVFS